MNMSESWQILKSAPVILAVFQLKYQKDGVELKDFLQYDTVLRRTYPNRNDNYNSNINVPKTITPGISTVTGKVDTKINSYIYFTKDQKRKLIIENSSITYTDENKYSSWEAFKNDALSAVEIFKDVLNQSIITRISIRFINKFSIESFDNPLDYFTTTISSSNADGLPYPLTEYAFKTKTVVPDTNIYSYVNQSINPVEKGRIEYIFDIDVLDVTNSIFEKDFISAELEQLRTVKNKLFFNNLQPKTIELCN